jgi:hypothetical protein
MGSPRTRSGCGQDTATDCPSSRTGHLPAPSMSRDRPRPRTRPRPQKSPDGSRARVGNGRRLSASSPLSRTIRSHSLAVDPSYPRASSGNRLSAPWQHHGPFAATESPNCVHNNSRLCPPLIPSLSAGQSRNLHRAVRRSSKTCPRPRKSLPSCGKSAPPTAPLPNCSPNIACRPAKPTLPCSVTKSSEKSSALTAVPEESACRACLRQMASKPLSRGPRAQRPICQPTRRLLLLAFRPLKAAPAVPESPRCECSNPNARDRRALIAKTIQAGFGAGLKAGVLLCCNGAVVAGAKPRCFLFVDEFGEEALFRELGSQGGRGGVNGPQIALVSVSYAPRPGRGIHRRRGWCSTDYPHWGRVGRE